MLRDCHRRRLRRLLFGLALAALPACADVTLHPPAPEQIPGVTRVEAAEVLQLVEREPQLVIIDSRITMDRRQGYLEGSVSLPDTETRCDTLARAIPAKDRPVLFYCNGVKCGRSVVAVKVAQVCGYQRLYWYRSGFEDWKSQGFPYLKK